MRSIWLIPRSGFSTVTRSLASWKASRSEVATSAGPSRSRDGRREEVVGLVAGRLRTDEAERGDQLGGEVELLEQGGVELAAGLVAGEGLVPVGRMLERVPATTTARGRSACQTPLSMLATPSSRFPGRPFARAGTTSAARGRRGARTSRRRRQQRTAHASEASSSSIAAIRRSVASARPRARLRLAGRRSAQAHRRRR